MNKDTVFSPPGEEISVELARKIAVLKKAMIKEREEKAKEAEEIEILKRNLSVLEITLSEKDSQNQIIYTEKEKAEKELYRLRDQIRQSGNSSLPQGARKSVANLEQQNKKLLDEYYFLKQQNVDLKNMISALSQEHEKIQKQINSKEKELGKVKSDLQGLLSESLKQQESLEKDLKDSKSAYVAMQETQEKLKIDLELATKKQKVIEDEWQVLNQQLLMKQGNIASLNERMLKLSENEAKLSSKLMDYKNELVEAEAYYQKHEVTKINQLNNHPAVIILKHDHNGNFIMEIEERKNHIKIEVENIEEIELNHHNDKRFFLRVSDGQTFDFESGKSETIVKKIKMFLQRIRDNLE